jgi:hypothetical protein
MVERCRALTTWHSLAVDNSQFWTLVDDARTASGARESPGPALIQRLASLSAEEILAFAFELEQERNSLYRWDVWAAAYLIGGGCSDDSFSDFRAGVVALGRDWCERVRTNPDALAEHPVVLAAAPTRDYVIFDEAFGYTAAKAFDRRAAGAESFWDAYAAYRMTRRADTAVAIGEEFDFDDDRAMRERLPRLARLYLSV